MLKLPNLKQSMLKGLMTFKHWLLSTVRISAKHLSPIADRQLVPNRLVAYINVSCVQTKLATHSELNVVNTLNISVKRRTSNEPCTIDKEFVPKTFPLVHSGEFPQDFSFLSFLVLSQMQFPIPPSDKDVVGSQRFLSDFVGVLPNLLALLQTSQNEVLRLYVRRSLCACQHFLVRNESGDGDPLLAECISLLDREKFDNLLECAEKISARQAPMRPTDRTVWFTAAFSLILCGCAVVIAALFGHSIEHFVVAGICGASFVLSALSFRSLSKKNSLLEENCLLSIEFAQDILTVNSGPLSNPLQQQPATIVTVDEEFGHVAAPSFFIEPEEAVRRKAQVDAILMETDDDDGKIFVRTRGFARVAISLGALNKHLLLVVTDLEGKVVYWNEGAALLCGFSARDAEGKHISSFLFGDKSQQLFTRMTDAAVNGVDATAKLLSMANLTHGSINLRASVVLARSAENESALGFVVFASSQESDSLRSLSQFHQYFVTDLLSSTPKDDQRRSTVEYLQWKNLEDLATASREWSPVPLQAVLSDVVKDRHRQCDVRVTPNVSELLVCDQAAVTRAMVQTLQLIEGKVRINVSQRRLTDAVHQLVVQFNHRGRMTREALEGVRRGISDAGCDMHSEDGTVRLGIPFVNEGGSGGDSLRPKGDKNSEKTQSQPPMTILLLEKNAVYRHNISTIAWGCGHSLRVVDSLQKALQSVNEYSSDLGCAVVDADLRDSERLVEALARHKIFTIETSESADSTAKTHNSFVTKPTTRLLLEKEFQRAAQSINERKKVDEEVLRQREIFGKVRNSPWTRGKKLGRGAFADVFEATSTLTGGKMAVKMIRLVGGFKEKVKDLMNEIEILCSMTHPHIIHYFYCERAETTINLFMELADESLADRLAVQPRMTEDQLAAVTKQLLLAVNYLHDQNIIHRDIKPGNMLISKGKIKLSDFGTATNSVISEGTEGTIFYMAPEVVDGGAYGKECDIWSIGCVMCECLGVKRPSRQNGLLGFGIPSAFPTDVSPTCQEFILLCLQDDPSERPTASSLLLHDFIIGARQESSQIGRLPITEQQWGGESSKNLSISSGESTPSW